MGLLFSRVTVSAYGEEESFLVKGTPQDEHDLDGWTVYDRFVQEIDANTDVQVHAESYLYGGGEAEQATVCEVAYLTKRWEADPEFLNHHCIRLGEVDFSFEWCPEELFGPYDQLAPGAISC